MQFISASNTAPTLAETVDTRPSRAFRSSATWTSSSGDLAMFSDTDEIEDRTRFVLEYNRLAKKHGIRVMVVGEFGSHKSKSVPNTMAEQRNWLSRIWHRASTGHGEPESKHLRHRRSFSDLAAHLRQVKREPPMTRSLQSMVTLSGKNLLYLPPEFSPRALVLPTCFRATAQFLVQHGVVTRGVFRISGSIRTVNALFDYYWHEDAEEEVTRTIRCPNLPMHIKASVHDVASAFKRFLGVLPGGILGSLALFDALIAIHSQLRGEPEFHRTRQTKLRARLMAIAIGTLKSQFRRELICAVFGLLSLIGRQAEVTPHEDEQGRPLPTSDLMGYSALGIVFGPLLVGNLLDSYTMKVAHPSSGLLLFPLTPPKLKKERAQKANLTGDRVPTVNKIHVANEITEMVITHWREVVRHLSSLGVLTAKGRFDEDRRLTQNFLRSSTSEGLPMRKRPDSYAWTAREAMTNHQGSPGIDTQIPSDSKSFITLPTRSNSTLRRAAPATPTDMETLSVRRLRPNSTRSESSNRISIRHSLNPLSPTAEESLASDEMGNDTKHSVLPVSFDTIRYADPNHGYRQMDHGRISPDPFTTASNDLENRPPRDSKPSLQSRFLCQSAGSDAGEEGDDELCARKTPLRSPIVNCPSTGSRRRERSSHPPPLSAGIISARLRRLVGSGESSSGREPDETSKDEGLCPRRSTTLTRGRQRSIGERKGSRRELNKLQDLPHASAERRKTEPTRSKSPATLPSPMAQRRNNSIQTTPQGFKTFCASMEEPQGLQASTENGRPVSRTTPQDTPANATPLTSLQGAQSARTLNGGKISQSTPRRGSASPFITHADEPTSRPRVASIASVASSVADVAQRTRAATLKSFSTPVKQDPPTATPATQPTLRKSASRPAGVRAMAAMWEGTSKDMHSAPSPARNKRRLTGTKPGGIVSPYRSNDTPLNKPSDGAANASLPMTHGLDAVKARFTPKKTLRTTASESLVLGELATRDEKGLTPKTEFQDVQLKHAEQVQKPVSEPVTPLEEDRVLDRTLDRPPSLGKMVPHQEEPPVDRHMNFSRPPSAMSISLAVPDVCEALEGVVSIPTPSPAPGGGNCLLHAQIRNLQKQLNARCEEVTSLRRQLETMENMDTGTLSEQLRDAKRECLTWKSRAEAAEKRVAVFERFTARLRVIRAADEAVNQISGEAKDTMQGNRSVSMGQDSMISNMTTGTEDADTVAARIRHSFKALDGTRSQSAASSVSNSGGAEAWWNVIGSIGNERKEANADRAEQAWAAVQELLAYDDLMLGMEDQLED